MILVCGEALIDLFTQVDDASEPSLKVTMGGSPIRFVIAAMPAPPSIYWRWHWLPGCDACGVKTNWGSQSSSSIR